MAENRPHRGWDLRNRRWYPFQRPSVVVLNKLGNYRPVGWNSHPTIKIFKIELFEDIFKLINPEIKLKKKKK